VVHCDAIASAQRDESGKLTLTLRERPDHLVVSRLYADRFRGM
jgi:DNA-binding LytR/AlgR family response regulator